jgi:hypothetical protein
MYIINLSRPGESPQDGDYIEIHFINGHIVQCYYWESEPPEEPEPAAKYIYGGTIVSLLENSEILAVIGLADTNDFAKAINYRLQSNQPINVNSDKYLNIVNWLFDNSIISQDTKDNLLALRD